MNPSVKDSNHPSYIYYDSDYPSRQFPEVPENFDPTVWQQGIGDDVEKYQRIAAENGKNVIELCCGTGRISIPLVAGGCTVTAVDISPALLKRLQAKADKLSSFARNNLTILKQDVTRLSLGQKTFDVAICAFNSLLCIPDFNLQQETLLRAAEHLRPGGILALDIANPLALNLHGDEIPEFFFTRKRTDNGNNYSRFCATGAMNIKQVQPLFGWYDETNSKGIVTRTSYHLEWRLIFRYELELMLEKAGFKITKISGGNNDEPLLPASLKMFVEAVLK
jgi:SAM-dependent methyltransferase